MTIQSLLFFDVFGNNVDVEGITNTELGLSIVSAVLNSATQAVKLYLESKAVQSNFWHYTLHCCMGRVNWIPFETQIDSLLKKKSTSISKTKSIKQVSNNNNNDSSFGQQNKLCLNYKIQYQLPIISRLLKIKNTVEYDFSSTSIRFLIAKLSVLTVKNNGIGDQSISVAEKNSTTNYNGNNTFDYKDGGFGTPSLSISFGQSLRLLSFQDILLLLRVCKNKNIELPGIDDPNVIDFENAISISQSNRRDPRLLQHARDAHGRPLLMSFCDLSLKSELRSSMTIRLINLDFDVNLTDSGNGTLLLSAFFWFFCFFSAFLFFSTLSIAILRIFSDFFDFFYFFVVDGC